MRQSSSEPLTLEIKFSFGKGLAEVTADHPLLSPIRKSIATGKPPGAWRYIFCREIMAVPHAVGAFVLTAGQRFLFFPTSHATVTTDEPSATFNHGQLDHITLDPANATTRSSHVAILPGASRKTRGLNYRSKPPRGPLFPWFSLITPNLDGFVPAPHLMRATFPPPRADIGRFASQLLGTVGADVVELPVAPTADASFLQLDVWAATAPDWEASHVPVLAWAYKDEIIRNAPPVQQQLLVRRLNLRFPEGHGLALVVTRPRGELSAARLLRPTVAL